MLKQFFKIISSMFLKKNETYIDVPEVYTEITEEKKEVISENKERKMLKPNIVQMPLPNFRVGWPTQADVAIIHYSAGYSVEDCFNALLGNKLSVHESVERDGTIYQHLNHGNRGIHAGYGQWSGRGNMNSRAFGVEVINFGWGYEGSGEPSSYNKFGPPNDELIKDAKTWFRVESYKKNGKKISTRVLTNQKMSNFADHRDEHLDKLWAEFPDNQVESTNWLVWEWLKENPNIILENVVGHEHVTPHRKTDPGPAWPWRKTEAFLETMAEKERPELLDHSYRAKDRIKAVQSHVRRCGVDIGAVDGLWGPATSNGVRQLIETYNAIYELNLDMSDVRENKSLKLSNAFRLIPGFNPGSR